MVLRYQCIECSTKTLQHLHIQHSNNIPDRASSWPTSPVAGTMCLLSSGHNGGLYNLTCMLGLNHYDIIILCQPPTLFLTSWLLASLTSMISCSNSRAPSSNTIWNDTLSVRANWMDSTFQQFQWLFQKCLAGFSVTVKQLLQAMHIT